MNEHLSEGAARVLHLSLEERRRYVSSSDWTVKHAHLVRLMGWVREKIAGPRIDRAEGLILHSVPFNGKTSMLKYVRATLGPKFEGAEDEYPKQRVVYVLATKAMKPNDLLISILSDILPPQMVHTTPAAVKKQLRVVLAAVQARVLMIDELQDMLVGGQRKADHLGCIKDLSNEFGLHIIGAGLSTLENLMANEAQLGTRFATARLPLWRVDEADVASLRTFAGLVDAIVRNMPLPEPSLVTSDESLRELGEMNPEGTLGMVFRTVVGGALLALDEGATALTMDHVRRAQALRLKGLFELDESGKP